MDQCFKNRGRCAIDGLEEKPEQIFIGIPFKPPYTDFYEYGIQPALQELSLTPWIALEHPGVGDLLCKICQGLQNSSAAIIDISEENPNVYFELGILARASKPFILIKQEGKPVPSDLRGMEYAEYSSAKTLIKALSDRLKLIIASKTHPQIMTYATYRSYYSDSLHMLNSAKENVDLTHIRDEAPSDFVGSDEWFSKIVEWANEHPYGRIRRIISVSNEKMVDWAKQLLDSTTTIKHNNFEIRVCEWKANFPAINMAIFDSRRVCIALTGYGATDTAGFTVSERVVANYFINYYNNVWIKSLPLNQYFRDHL